MTTARIEEDEEMRKEETEAAKKLHFSDLSEEELTAMFSGLPPFRFEFCSGFVIYYSILAHHKLFGTIQAAAGGFSPDPLLQQNGFSDAFNREFDNPVHVFSGGHDGLHELLHCSLPLSSPASVIQILAKLYVTTDEVDEKIVKVHNVFDEDEVRAFEMERNRIIEACSERAKKDSFCRVAVQLKTTCTIWSPLNKDLDYIDNEAFQVCDDHAFINLADNPNGGSGNNIFEGRDGSLELYYVTLKYAVDAHLEVEFVPPSKKSKVAGRLKAYYGKDFGYDFPADDYHVIIFETDPPNYVKGGKINLMRPVLAVPAKFSLIIEAELFDDISRNDVLSGTYEFFVPLDGSPSFGSIASTDCSIKLKVNWKLPIKNEKFPSSPIYPPASNSSISRLTERRKFGAASTSTFADPDEEKRWSLQEEIEKVFNSSLQRTFGGDHQETVSCCISACAKEDGCDYICSSVLHIWHELRETRLYGGPNCAGLAVKDNITRSEYKDMLEKCVVCGPGFVKFKLSGKWIAKAIYKMLTDGIDTWAPKLSVTRASVYFLPRNMAEEMRIRHLRSTFIGETLARMLEYSGVVVLRKRNIRLSSPLLDLTDFRRTLDEENVDWIVYVTDVEQRDNFEFCITAAKGAGLIANHHSKYPISHVGFGPVQGVDFERFQTSSTNLADLLYEAKSRGRALLARRGMADELTAQELEHAAEALGYGAVKYADLKNNRLADYTFSFDQMLNEEAAKGAGLIANHHSKYPISHVGFGLVQGDNFERFQTSSTNLADLLYEAKNRGRALLARRGMADEWTAEELEHAAEALGYGALKYADLKNYRLSDYTFSFDQMLNEEGNTAVYLQFTHVRICSVIRDSRKDIKKLKIEELILKNDDERELGLHLLRFTEVLGEASSILAPHLLCEYLYELCNKSNGLHSSVCQVSGSSEEMSRLLLFEATEVVMRKCSDLLGITPVSKI